MSRYLVRVTSFVPEYGCMTVQFDSKLVEPYRNDILSLPCVKYARPSFCTWHLELVEGTTEKVALDQLREIARFIRDNGNRDYESRKARFSWIAIHPA